MKGKLFLKVIDVTGTNACSQAAVPPGIHGRAGIRSLNTASSFARSRSARRLRGLGEQFARYFDMAERKLE